MQVQELRESVEHESLNHFNQEIILRDGKPSREDCFPPEQAITAVAQLEAVSSKG